MGGQRSLLQASLQPNPFFPTRCLGTTKLVMGVSSVQGAGPGAHSRGTKHSVCPEASTAQLPAPRSRPRGPASNSSASPSSNRTQRWLGHVRTPAARSLMGRTLMGN